MSQKKITVLGNIICRGTIITSCCSMAGIVFTLFVCVCVIVQLLNFNIIVSFSLYVNSI